MQRIDIIKDTEVRRTRDPQHRKSHESHESQDLQYEGHAQRKVFRIHIVSAARKQSSISRFR